MQLKNTAEGHVGGAATADPRRTRPEVGGRPETTADSSAASRLTNRAQLGVECGGSTPAVVLVNLAVAFPPVVKLAGCDSEPPNNRPAQIVDRAICRFGFRADG